MPINREDFILRFKTDTVTASAELDRFAAKVTAIEQKLGRLGSALASTGSGRVFDSGLVDRYGQSIGTVAKAEEQLVIATRNVTTSIANQAKAKDAATAQWLRNERQIQNAITATTESIKISQDAGLAISSKTISKLNRQGENAISLAGAAPATVAAADAAALRTSGQAAITYASQLKVAATSAAALAVEQRAIAATSIAAEKAANQLAAAAAKEDAAIMKLTLDLERQQRQLAFNAEFGQRPNIHAVNAALQTATSLQTATAGLDKYRAQNILATRAVTDLSNQQAILKPRVDAATAAFSRHTITIAQGLLVYSTFSKALEAFRSGIETVINVTKETTRLGMVVGALSKSQTDEFLHELGRTAIETNTSFEQLVETTDLVAGALAGFGDQSKESRLSLINDFQRIAGEFSNLVASGSDLAIVDKQLVDLFNIFKPGFSGIEDFRRLLDKIVVLNHNNATGIALTTDALESSGLAAQRAGFNLELLTSIFSKLVFSSHKSGTELGNLFTTVLAKLQNPLIVGKLSELTAGVVTLTDSVGNLKEADVILSLIATHQKELEALAPGRFAEILGTFGQTINPGQANIMQLFATTTVQALDEMAAGTYDFDAALKKANEELSKTLAFKFGAFGERIVVGINAMRDSIGGALGSLLGFGNVIVDFFGKLGPGFGTLIAQILAFATAMGTINLLGPKILAFYTSWFIKLKTTTLALGATTAATGSLAVAGAEASVSMNGVSAAQARAALSGEILASSNLAAASSFKLSTLAVNGFKLAIKTLGPLLLILGAIEIASSLMDQAKQIDALVKDLGITKQEAEGLVHPIPAGARPITLSDGRSGYRLPSGQVQLDRAAITTRQGQTINAPRNDKERGALAAYIQAVLEIEEAGNAVGTKQEEIDKKITLATNALVDQGGAYITTANGAQYYVDIANGVISTADQEQARIEGLREQLESGKITRDQFNEAVITGESVVRDATEAELLEARVQQNLTATTMAVGKAIGDLSKDYINGKITLDEYNQGLLNVDSAHQNAAKLVATFGDGLRVAFPELQKAKGGAAALTEAMFQLLLRSGDISGLQSQIDAIIAMGTTYGAVADTINRNPIYIALNFGKVMAQLTAVAKYLPSFLRGIFVSQGLQAFLNPSSGGSSAANSALAALNKALAAAGRSNAAGGAGAGTSSPAPGILDIGDLPADKLAAAIAKAIALRNAIPGQTARDAKDIVNLIKDANYLTTVRGVSEELLREAIQALTEQMKQANELAKNSLSNLVVNAGSLAGLITAPTLLGINAIGSPNAGLNFNPANGNIVVNFNGDFTGMTPDQVQSSIYNAITKAIRDAGRL